MNINRFLQWITILAVFSLSATLLVGPSQADSGNENSEGNRTTTPVVERINTLIEQSWKEYSLKPSKEATDGEWCRRVFLDVIGRVPTVAELRKFTSDRSEDKKAKLVEMLLHDDSYTEEFARNMTTIWTNLLIGRTGGTQNNSMISRRGMQKFLRDSFARGKSYDTMVNELITATGSTLPGADDFNGATNYLIDKVNEESAALATASTTKLFLGLQVQCTQCHNHPFNDWKQQKYWEVNAFFRQVRAFPGGPRGAMGASKLADQDFRGEGPSADMENAALFFEMRNGIVKSAFPVFVDGTEISPSGYVNVSNRRKEFSRLVVNSPYFSKVMVNRTWAHFLGYGFTKPVDDLGPHNTPTNPELLEYLAQQFRSSEYDIRELISWITLSKPYQLSSIRTNYNRKDDPALGEAPRFSHFYLRQMRPEELYESLLVATQAANNRGSYEEQEQLKSNWLRQFSQAFGTDEGDETTTFNGTIPQILMLFNGDLIKAATAADSGMIAQLAADQNSKIKQKIDYLFLAGLSRRPKSQEMDVSMALVNARNGNTLEALKDVWWVVLNSNEFIFNH